jgi:hypothetical protein
MVLRNQSDRPARIMKTTPLKQLLAIVILVAGCVCRSSLAGDNGLLFYLPLNQDLLDHSPNRLPVTVTNQVEIRNGSAWFSGKESWLEFPHVDFGKDGFAVTMWIKLTGRGPMYGLLDQMDEVQSSRWLHLMLRGGRQPYLGFMMNDAMSPFGISTDEWTHLAFQYTGTHQQIWINGVLICARESNAYRGVSGETRVGRSPRWDNVPSLDFEGAMADLRGYNRVLTPSEIALLASAVPGGGSRAIIKTLGQSSVNPRSPLVAQDAAPILGVPFLSIEGRKLVITGESRQIYDIQVTENMSDGWQNLVTLTNQLGNVEYLDTSHDSAQRFYRIVVRNSPE